MCFSKLDQFWRENAAKGVLKLMDRPQTHEHGAWPTSRGGSISWILWRGRRKRFLHGFIRKGRVCKHLVFLQSKLGKFIPVEVLMDILLSQKNADIAKLKKKIDLLQKLLIIYEKLDLTECQQAQFDQMASINHLTSQQKLNIEF